MVNPHIPIDFVTTNSMKFDIARAYFEGLGDAFELKQLPIELPEIQAETVEDVAIYAAREAVNVVGEACVVGDSGFCIEALGGFPGPFLKYANNWLGASGYLNLLRGEANRRAYFEELLEIVREMVPDARPPFLHVTLAKNAASPYGIGVHSVEDFGKYCRELDEW